MGVTPGNKSEGSNFLSIKKWRTVQCRLQLSFNHILDYKKGFKIQTGQVYLRAEAETQWTV